MNYNLDTSAAKKADQFNARIEQTGIYKGVFTRAEEVTSKNGAKGIDLSFKADTGESADYLTIWTHGRDGSEIRGFNLLMAIMTCLRVKAMEAKVGTIEKYNQDSKTREQVSVPLFNDLMNKPIGLLIQMEEYEKTAGGTAWKPAIFSVCDKDGFVATEILGKSTKAETFDKMAVTVKDRPLKGAKLASSANTSGSSTDPFDDQEIPFN
jgi:hypothetical protein